jgi:flavin-dependent dehydrogenase
LSHEAARYVDSLGVDLHALGAVSIDTLRLSVGQRSTRVHLPFAALSVSRRVLDAALLARATAAGATVRRGAKVVSLDATDDGWRAQIGDADVEFADTVFLATGKHDVHSHRRPPGGHDDLVAFKMHWTLAGAQSDALARHVELTLFEGGYAGLQPIERGRANLCLVVRRDRLRALGGRWGSLLTAIRAEAPLLDARLYGALPAWSKPLSLAPIPYGHVQRRADGLFRLGDQAAVIPSFSGDGISIALHSGDLASTTFLAGGDAEAFQGALARDVSTQVALATTRSRGLVHGPVQRALGLAARLWPELMSVVASRTRIPDAALARASLARAS